MLEKLGTLKPNSLNNHYWVLVLVLDYCVRRKWLAVNPLHNERVKLLKGMRRRQVHIPQDRDVEHMVQFFNGPKPLGWHRVAWANAKIDFALGAFGNFRRGESVALRWENIDLARMRLKIPEEDGACSIYDGIGRPKTPSSVRSLPITQYLFDALMDHGHGLNNWSGFVLVNEFYPEIKAPRGRSQAKPHVEPRSVSKWFHKAMLDAELVNPDGTVRFRRHGLRHFYGSMSLALGHDLAKVSRRMGHANPSITTSLYVHSRSLSVMRPMRSTWPWP